MLAEQLGPCWPPPGPLRTPPWGPLSPLLGLVPLPSPLWNLFVVEILDSSRKPSQTLIFSASLCHPIRTVFFSFHSDFTLLVYPSALVHTEQMESHVPGGAAVPLGLLTATWWARRDGRVCRSPWVMPQLRGRGGVGASGCVPFPRASERAAQLLCAPPRPRVLTCHRGRVEAPPRGSLGKCSSHPWCPAGRGGCTRVGAGAAGGRAHPTPSASLA